MSKSFGDDPADSPSCGAEGDRECVLSTSEVEERDWSRRLSPAFLMRAPIAISMGSVSGAAEGCVSSVIIAKRGYIPELPRPTGLYSFRDGAPQLLPEC